MMNRPPQRDAFWQRRYEAEIREVIRAEIALREKLATGKGPGEPNSVFGRQSVDDLRRNLVIHTVALAAAKQGRHPTKAEIKSALDSLARDRIRASRSEGIDRGRMLELAEGSSRYAHITPDITPATFRGFKVPKSGPVKQWVFTVQSSRRLSPDIQDELKDFKRKHDDSPKFTLTRVDAGRDKVVFHVDSSWSSDKIDSAFDKMFDQGSEELRDAFQINWARSTQLDEL